MEHRTTLTKDSGRFSTGKAELVVKLNHSGPYNLLVQSIAVELIQNSRLGAENAANISALIWQALKELKASGVKTYYTAEELKEMAQNISQNGLPQETVKALKAQGWTDEQIQALEEYIVKHADEINEDFNMTAFLENFSMAFISVAFKYNHYEAWALEKWKWTQPVEAPTTNNKELINPAVSGGWVMLYLRYSQGDYQRMDSAAETLKESMYRLITGAGGSVTLLSYERTTSLSQFPGSVDSVKWSENGSLLFTVTARRMTGREVITEKKTYYWPNALRAYELVSNVIALVKARNYGNNNAKIDSMLNQKVAELKDALKVIEVSSEVTRTPITSPVKPVPIKPGKPITPDPLPELPLKSTSGANMTPIIIGGAGEVMVNGVSVDQSVLVEALDTQNDPGMLVITDVAVVVDSNVPGSVEYHVEVSFKAEDNAVNNIRIKVKDYTTGDLDSGSISFLNSGEGYTWKSGSFTLVHSMDGEATVSGRVEITYTPSCGAVPLSQESPEASSTPSSCGERSVAKEYSATVDLTSPVDWSKVNVRVEASRTSITEGESVTYRVVVRNDQDVELDGVEYSVTIPFSPTNSRTYSGTVDVKPNGESVILEKTVTYTDASTYTTHASIHWNGNSKSAEKSVTVTSGTLSITGVDVSPSNPTHGDSVSFDVSIKNPVSRSRSVTVKLFIDGQEKSSKSLTIGGGSTGSVTLTWTAQAGEHEYRIEVWEDGKLEASRSGGITVSGTPSNSFNVVLTAYPTELEGGGEVYLQVKAWNYDGSSITVKGFIEFDGDRIKTIEAKIPANANGDSILALSYNLVGVGNHSIKLFLDNYDGKPNWAGEEHWSEVKVEVKPWKADLKLECDDEIVLGENDRDDLDCTLYLLRTNPDDSMQVKISEIDIGGAKVWPSNFKGVTLSKDTLKVTPYDPDDETHIKITIDEDFAEFYFGIDPRFPWHSYVDKLATEKPWEIVVRFENAPPTSTTFKILKNGGTTIEDAVEYGGSGTFVATEILEKVGYITTEASGPGRLAVIGSRLFGYAGLLLFISDIAEEAYFYGWRQPRDFDNDGFVG